MIAVKRRGLWGTVITLVALAALVTTSNMPVHASSHPDLVNKGGMYHSLPLLPGGSFTLTSRLENEGSGNAPATTLRYYRSSDTTITTSDTEVGTDSVDALASGEHVNHWIDLTAPSSPGSYKYGSCVDAVANETATTNNCTGYVTIVVSATGSIDVSVSPAKASPSRPVVGETFTLSTRVSNRGSGESPATTLRYYSSTDNAITTSDTEVGTDAIGAIAGGRNSQQSIDLTAPSVPGSYNYGVCVDTVPDETNTANNCQFQATWVSVTPAPIISGTAQVGQTLTASTSGISDPDGLTNTTYSYQWLADDTEIDGATSSTYTVQTSDNGKVIKVRVTFTDDAGNDESLTSAGTSAVVLGGL